MNNTSEPYKKPNRRLIIKVLAFVFVTFPIASFVIANLGLLFFIYAPKSYDELNVDPIKADTKHIIVLAHGLKDNADSWINPLKQQWQQQLDARQIKHTQVIALEPVFPKCVSLLH